MLQNERRQIIAIGGSGSLTESETLALERYVLSQARSTQPAVCFIPTANGDADASLVRFYTIFTQLPCRPPHLLFFRRTPVDLRAYLLSKASAYQVRVIDGTVQEELIPVPYDRLHV